MSAAYTSLEALRDAFAALPGVETCKIGLEANISPQDYPLIRLVVVRMTPGRPYSARTVELRIFVGWDASEAANGLESVYEALLALEDSVRDTLQAMGGRYLETITDEDTLQPFKMLVVRAEVST